MKVLLVILIVCALAVLTQAQTGGTVTGRYSEGVAVIGAEIKLYNSEYSFTAKTFQSNPGATYRFENVPPGSYTLEARAGLYKQNIIVESGKVLTLDIDANLPSQPGFSRGSVGQVTVIAAGVTQGESEVSKTVNVISGQEMRDRADFTLVDSLRSIPGFRVQQLGGFGKTASIKTRGLRNQDTAVLIDGVRFRDAASITGDATPFLSDFTLTSVSRIEVLHGSGSSLYGTNAIGGVIDFQTPEPPNGWHGQVSVATGGLGLGRFRGNISNGSSDGKFGFNAGISRTVYTKGIDGDDYANNTNFQGKLVFQPMRKTHLSARFFFSDAFVRLNSNPDTAGTPLANNFGIIRAVEGVTFTPDADDPDDTQKSRFFDGQVVVNQIVNRHLVFSGYYSGLTTRRRNESGPMGIGFQSASTNVFDGTIHTANGHLNWTPNSINEITAGYEFEHEKYGNDGFVPDGSADFTVRAIQASHTFYVQDLVHLLNDRLQLAGGFRAQSFDLRTPKFSTANAPYLNITLENPPTAYTFDGATSYYFQRTATKLRAHVGNGYRVPSLFERFGTFFATFLSPNRFVPLGAPDLKPERSIAFDSGIEQGFFKEKARLSATYFYTRLLDSIKFGLLPQPDRFGRDNLLSGGGYFNGKGGIARGAEFSATVKPTKSTDIFTSYTFTNSDQREPQVAGSGVIESLGIPKHQFTLVTTQRIKRFWVNFDLLLASDYLAPIFSSTTFNSYVYRFRGNHRGDLTAGYNFGWKKDRLNMRLFATVENIFDDRYFENGFKTPGRNGRIGLNFSF